MHTNKLLALLLFIGLVSSTTITLNDTNLGNIGDTYVYQGAASTNYGTRHNMSTAPTSNNVQRIFVLINNSYGLIPTTANISSVTLSLYVYNGLSAERTLQAYNTSLSNGSALWTEANIDWNTQPAAVTLQEAKATGTTNGTWITWDITNAFKASWNSATPSNVSIVIKDSNEGTGTTNPFFSTKENATTTTRPQVTVTYTIPSCLESGLVGYWKFDENTGTYAYDSSLCGGNTGILYNSPTWTTGKNYQTPHALSFDGATNYVSNTFPQAVDPMNFTVSAWIYPTSTDAGSVFELYNATSEWTFYSYGTFRLHNGSNDVYAGSAVPQNTWSHIAITYDGTYISGYLNGVLINSSTIAPSALHTPISPTFYIGTHYTWSTRFKGIIDEVKIYNESKNATWAMSEFTRYCPLHPISIDTWNESSTSQYLNSFTMVASNSTNAFTYTTGPIYNVSFTDYYCNSSFPIGSVTISISNSSFYSPRYYYSTLAYGGSYTLAAYLMPLTDTYPILTSFVILSGGSIVENALVTVQKQVGGSWTTIAQKYTDSSGSAAFNLDYQTIYYIITTASGYPSRYDYITPTSTIYYLTLAQSTTSAPFWLYYGQYQAACEVTNETYPAILIDCSLNDTSGHLTNTYLSVKSIGTFGSVMLCDNTTTPNNTLSCYIEDPSEKTIAYSLSARTSSDPGYVTVLSEILAYLTISNFENYGILPAFILVMTLGFAGVAVSPALGVITAISGVWLSAIMQLVTISPAGLIGLTAVGVILAYMLRQ